MTLVGRKLTSGLVLLLGCANTTTVSEKGSHDSSEKDTLIVSERDLQVSSERETISTAEPSTSWVKEWIGEYEGVGAAMYIPFMEDSRFIGYQEGWNEGFSVRLKISSAGAHSVNISGGADSSLTKDEARKFFKNFGVGFIPLQNIPVNSAEAISGESRFNFGSTVFRVEYNFTRHHGMLSGYVKQYNQFKSIPDQAVRFDILKKVTEKK